MDELKQQIAQIKQQFMALRNGIIGDTYRRAGINCYDVIFGLNVPQLGEIARSITPSNQLADALWADKKVRESRLLSAWLWEKESVSPELIERLLGEAQTNEERNILTWRLSPKQP
jgi:hypothetical protein